MMIRISETMLIDPKKITATELIKEVTSEGERVKLVMYADGMTFSTYENVEELLRKFMEIDETAQFWAGR